MATDAGQHQANPAVFVRGERHESDREQHDLIRVPVGWPVGCSDRRKPMPVRVQPNQVPRLSELESSRS